MHLDQAVRWPTFGIWQEQRLEMWLWPHLEGSKRNLIVYGCLVKKPTLRRIWPKYILQCPLNVKVYLFFIYIILRDVCLFDEIFRTSYYKILESIKFENNLFDKF